MDREERELFGKGLGRATAAMSGVELDAALDELGWREALHTDPRAAVTTLFELQGADATTSSALDAVLLDALGEPDLDAAVVLPPLGRWEPPAELNGDGLVVRGLATAAIARRSGALVATAGRVCAVAPEDLTCRTIRGLDPVLGLVEVTGSTTRATPLPAGSGGSWEDAVAAGQRALAHELVGASAAMLELARGHALERIQFGVPIASFQAVRHRLADSLVAVESARGALDAAWEAGSAFDAAVAKAIVGRAARLVAKHAQQVLAGIGFTLEHPLHRYVRRVRLLDGLLGDARSLTREVGERLLRERAVPPMLPL